MLFFWPLIYSVDTDLGQPKVLYYYLILFKLSSCDINNFDLLFLKQCYFA